MASKQMVRIIVFTSNETVVETVCALCANKDIETIVLNSREANKPTRIEIELDKPQPTLVEDLVEIGCEAFARYLATTCPLSKRQRAIVQLMAEGLYSNEIAPLLGWSRWTVRKDVEAVATILGTGVDRTIITRMCLQKGWIY